MAFLPAAHGSRQYVGLLREGLERVGVEVRDLPRLPSADWVREHAGPSTVMHLHMPAYDYSKGTANREEVLRRLQIWEAGIGQARASGCGLVWTAHNLYPHDSPHRDLHHRARVTLLKHATAVIAHCRRGTEEVQRNFGGAADITVIPHPHYRESYDLWSRDEARQALDLPPDALVYLNLGMIRPYKGQERLLRAFSSLQDPSARLVIAGAAFGASGEAGEDLVGRLRGAATLDPRVIIRPDRVPDSLVPAYFAACDFAVFAYTEVLTSGGIALAQTMERPVIAPAIGCIPEMVPEGTGIVYEPGTTAALEAALRRARSLPASAGARAWESIRPFDWMTTAVATREVYRKAIRISADGLRARPPELRP